MRDLSILFFFFGAPLTGLKWTVLSWETNMWLSLVPWNVNQNQKIIVELFVHHTRTVLMKQINSFIKGLNSLEILIINVESIRYLYLNSLLSQN